MILHVDVVLNRKSKRSSIREAHSWGLLAIAKRQAGASGVEQHESKNVLRMQLRQENRLSKIYIQARKTAGELDLTYTLTF